MSDHAPITTLPIAPLWRRLAAMVYDTLVVAALAMAYWAAAIYLKYGLLGATLAEGEKAQLPLSALAGLLVFIGVFFVFFWCRAGQTVGMRAWRLKVENGSGDNLNWQTAALRYGLANLSLWLGGIGYWWQLLDKSGTLHDRLSGTQVVVLPKK